MTKNFTTMVQVLILYVVALTAVIVTAQSSSGNSPSPSTSCASKLTACVAYLNATTTPPSSCCDPLKEAITNEKACLCSIYGNPTLIQDLNINLTQALNLPKLCHIDTGSSPNICQGAPGGSPSSSSTPSGSSPSRNAVDKIPRLVAILLMFGAYSMLK